MKNIFLNCCLVLLLITTEASAAPRRHVPVRFTNIYAYGCNTPGGILCPYSEIELAPNSDCYTSIMFAPRRGCAVSDVNIAPGFFGAGCRALGANAIRNAIQDYFDTYGCGA
jgi:hypothetical protein